MALTRVTKTGNITVDGDIGIGVVPGEWSVNYPAFQIGQGGTFTGHRNNTQTQLGQNWWVGTGNQYVVNGAASRMIMNPDSTIIFSQAPSGTAGATMSTTHNRLVINTSGHVTTPSQPAWSGGLNGSQSGLITSYSVHLNNGNHFSNGVFTCPVAGNYFISFFGMTSSAGTMDVELRINGSTRNELVPYSSSAGFHTSAGGTTVIYLNANDTIQMHNNNTQLYGNATGRHTGFSGYLIG